MYVYTYIDIYCVYIYVCVWVYATKRFLFEVLLADVGARVECSGPKQPVFSAHHLQGRNSLGEYPSEIVILVCWNSKWSFTVHHCSTFFGPRSSIYLFIYLFVYIYKCIIYIYICIYMCIYNILNDSINHGTPGSPMDQDPPGPRGPRDPRPNSGCRWPKPRRVPGGTDFPGPAARIYKGYIGDIYIYIQGMYCPMKYFTSDLTCGIHRMP